jgi:hypothetical protein
MNEAEHAAGVAKLLELENRLEQLSRPGYDPDAKLGKVHGLLNDRDEACRCLQVVTANRWAAQIRADAAPRARISVQDRRFWNRGTHR